MLWSSSVSMSYQTASYDSCQLVEVWFEQLVQQLKNNPYQYEIGATNDMMSRNISHDGPVFSRIFYAMVENVQECEQQLLSLLPDNHPYIYKQISPYPYPGGGYVYIICS